MSAAVACTPWRRHGQRDGPCRLVLFENRSFDNLLGRLYAPGEVDAFEGVIGKDLSNPVPDWAEHGAASGSSPTAWPPGMDAPEPRPGRGVPAHQHPAVQRPRRGQPLQGRHRDGGALQRTAAGHRATMDGFVTDYISFLTVELGRQPTYDEYSQIMTGYAPEQVPVMSALARGFGVFDHWFSEVPSQTLANRSFWTAATSSGFVVNRP